MRQCTRLARGGLLATLWFCAATSGGWAHTASPYLLPEQFDIKSGMVSFQSAITVEKFFVPGHNFKTSYQVTHPDGSTHAIEAAASLHNFNIAQLATPLEGTYRLVTHNAVGTPSRYALVEGRWLRIRQARAPMATLQEGTQANAKAANPPASQVQSTKSTTPANQPPRFIMQDQLPVGARIMETANQLIGETYISKGKPSPLPAISGKGFELKLLTHPSELYTGESLKAQVLFDGKPVPALEVEVFKGAGSYERNARREQPAVKTTENGEFEVRFEQSGIYLITMAYPAVKASPDQAPASQAYSYGLTVEVVD